jgi:hypothetical protein
LHPEEKLIDASFLTLTQDAAFFPISYKTWKIAKGYSLDGKLPLLVPYGSEPAEMIDSLLLI